jgi:hypothetical protein
LISSCTLLAWQKHSHLSLTVSFPPNLHSHILSVNSYNFNGTTSFDITHIYITNCHSWQEKTYPDVKTKFYMIKWVRFYL